MSFGWSVSDIALLVRLAYKTTQGARAACGDYDELTRETSSIHIILKRLQTEVTKPESSVNRRDAIYTHELKSISSGCEAVLSQLDKILVKYNALSEQERSARRLWKKIRFGSGAVVDLAELRSKITYYTSALSLFLNLICVSSSGEMEKKMDEAGVDLKDIKVAVNSITARLMANVPNEGSVMTAYTNDDRGAWRDLRRQLVKDGFSDSLVRRHKKKIMAYMTELGDRGILDPVDVNNFQDDTTIPETRHTVSTSTKMATASSDNSEQGAGIIRTSSSLLQNPGACFGKNLNKENSATRSEILLSIDNTARNSIADRKTICHEDLSDNFAASGTGDTNTTSAPATDSEEPTQGPFTVDEPARTAFLGKPDASSRQPYVESGSEIESDVALLLSVNNTSPLSEQPYTSRYAISRPTTDVRRQPVRRKRRSFHFLMLPRVIRGTSPTLIPEISGSPPVRSLLL